MEGRRKELEEGMEGKKGRLVQDITNQETWLKKSLALKYDYSLPYSATCSSLTGIIANRTVLREPNTQYLFPASIQCPFPPAVFQG
mmetsp:Transcript_29937/g.48361  ORF Transcript_29937/g.48361 Transcript_29937/m.48361 type:complete len:86 (+) Transcript_29937:13-270(+)